MDHPEETSIIDMQSTSVLSLPDLELLEETEISYHSPIQSNHDKQLSSTTNPMNLPPRRQEFHGSSKQKKKSNRRKQYLRSWEDDPASFYLSFYYDTSGVRHSRSICWLHKKTDEDTGIVMLVCRLCERYCMVRNTNGKENTWATKGFNVLALDKIKEHRSNERHKEAERLEVQRTSMEQPGWRSTQMAVVSRQQESIMNLMFCCVYICQNDHSLNSFTTLCELSEKIGSKLLPSEASGVNYRNDTSALIFLQHVSSVLHAELVKRLKESSVLGNRSCMIECSFINYTFPFSLP